MIELAPTGRAGCTTCGRPIAKGTPRVVETYEDPFRPEEVKRRFHHVACAAQVYPFSLRRWLDDFDGELPERAELSQIADLWQEVLVDRDDDGPRLVLADVLQAVSDPRGELFAAQLVGRATDDRIAELIEMYGRRWLRSLASHAAAVEFTRGLPTRLELSDRGSIAEHDPTLVTVEDFLSGSASGARYRELLGNAYARPKRVEVWDEDSLAALEGMNEHVALEHASCGLHRRGLDGLAPRFLRACERLSAVRSIAYSVAALDELRASPVFGRLERLVLVVDRLREAIPIWPALPHRLVVAISRTARLPTLSETPRGELVLLRTGNGLTVRAGGEWVREGLVEHLPRATDRLEIEGSIDALEPLRDAARDRAIELVAVAPPSTAGIWRWRRQADGADRL